MSWLSALVQQVLYIYIYNYIIIHVQYHTSNAYHMRTNFRRMYVLWVWVRMFMISFLAKRPIYYIAWRFHKLCVWDSIVAIAQQLDVHIYSVHICVLLLLLWKTLLMLSGVVDMSTLYLRRCAVAHSQAKASLVSFGRRCVVVWMRS